MKRIFILSALVLPVVSLGLIACNKSEKVENAKVEIAPVPSPSSAPAPEVKKAVPVIPVGTWTGTTTDGSEAPTLTIEAGNRLTITQQESPTSGSYVIDDSKNPVFLNFTPDGGQGKSFSSQIQWIDENTFSMTSFIDAALPSPVAAQTSPSPTQPAPAATPVQAPFTGNTTAPAAYTSASDTAVLPSTPVMDPVVFTIVFTRQQPASPQ